MVTETVFFQNIFPAEKKKSEKKYLHGTLHGTSTYWYENGKKKSEYNYSSGKIVDGIYFTYLENGQKEREETYNGGQKISEGLYKNGILSDKIELVLLYWPNKNKMFQGYVKNKEVETGMWTTWYENGQMHSTGEKHNGKAHGLWIFWSDDGRILEQGYYADGKKEGEFTYINGNKGNFFFHNDIPDEYYSHLIKYYKKQPNSHLLKRKTISDFKGEIM